MGPIEATGLSDLAALRELSQAIGCLATAGTRAATLIATAQGEPLYRTLGFVEVERVCRLITATPMRGPRLAPTPLATFPM